MLYKFSNDELRSLCKTQIETLESWARTIIHQTLTEELGSNYFNSELGPDHPVIKKSIKDKTDKMIKEHPERFPLKIDTLFLDDIIYLLCRKDLYENYFRVFLQNIYPDGREEVRTFLNQLKEIRNSLYHSNPISIREAEKCICYSNDFIDGIKKYLVEKGMNQKFWVPNAIKFNDSLGNEILLNNNEQFTLLELIDKTTNQMPTFNIGDRYWCELTMDPSFSENEYNIEWHLERPFKILGNGSRLDLVITEDMVNMRAAIYCNIKSNKTWHKFGDWDQQFAFCFQVLPSE